MKIYGICVTHCEAWISLSTFLLYKISLIILIYRIKYLQISILWCRAAEQKSGALPWCRDGPVRDQVALGLHNSGPRPPSQPEYCHQPLYCVQIKAYCILQGTYSKPLSQPEHCHQLFSLYWGLSLILLLVFHYLKFKSGFGNFGIFNRIYRYSI